MATDGDLRFCPEVRLLEIEVQVFAKIGAPLSPAAAASTASSEQIAESEEISEDVAEVLEDGRIEAGACTCDAAQPSMAEAIIERTFLSIREDRVRLTRFFEFLLGIRIVRIRIVRIAAESRDRRLQQLRIVSALRQRPAVTF